MRVTTSVSESHAAYDERSERKETVMTMRVSWSRTALIAAALLSLTSMAQERQSPPPSATPPPRQTEPPQQRPSPPPPPSQTGRPPPARPGDDVFIPSEELAADEEVTFPVDI
jgi:hypothetical protein